MAVLTHVVLCCFVMDLLYLTAGKGYGALQEPNILVIDNAFSQTILVEELSSVKEQ